MLSRSVKLYLEDIKKAIANIESYTKKSSFEQFRTDGKTIDAVVRNLEIIGEAARNIPKEIQADYPQVPWKEMIGMRNKVIHHYFGVELETLWGAIKRDLPDLKRKIKIIKPA